MTTRISAAAAARRKATRRVDGTLSSVIHSEADLERLEVQPDPRLWHVDRASAWRQSTAYRRASDERVARVMRLRARGTDQAMADRVVIELPDSRRTTRRLVDIRRSAACDQPHALLQLQKDMALLTRTGTREAGG